MSRARRKRILFVAEAVTLAHVSRPFVLAQSLDPLEFEVHFACASQFDFVFTKASFQRRKINSISPESFLRALATGSRLYSRRTLCRYVEEDLELIRMVRPDVIGRLSAFPGCKRSALKRNLRGAGKCLLEPVHNEKAVSTTRGAICASARHCVIHATI